MAADKNKNKGNKDLYISYGINYAIAPKFPHGLEFMNFVLLLVRVSGFPRTESKSKYRKNLTCFEVVR